MPTCKTLLKGLLILNLAVVLAVGIYIGWQWFHFAPPETPTYSRSDCAQKIDVLYPSAWAVDGQIPWGRTLRPEIADRALEENSLWNAILNTLVGKFYPFLDWGGGIPTQTPDGYAETFYILYWQLCSQKYEITQRLIEPYLKAHAGEVKITLSRERVLLNEFGGGCPQGGWWTDGRASCQ